MEACFGAFNTKGFVSALENNELPSETHITYGGLFNQVNFSIGPKAKKPLQLHIGYARAQNQYSYFDSEVNDYLAIFTKGSKDGEDRDDRILNSVIILDISGSMGSGLTSNGEGCRIQLAKQAILMFFSKLRPNDSFGLVLFNNKAENIIPVKRVSDLQFEEVANIVKKISPRGGTTLMAGFNQAHSSLKQYLQKTEFSKGKVENRMLMLTDVCDNSFHNASQFIKLVQQTNIHTTIIGVSDDFRSEVCQQLIEVKGFNYFCATEVDDLKKYLFENFSFTFFPSNYDIQIEIQNENIKSIEVFGTVDAEKVSTYNADAKGTFKVTHTKTSFPSELEISQEGSIKTFGGLMLVKLALKDKDKNIFDSIVRVKYNTVAGQQQKEQYPVHYQTPPKEQFYSQESLSQALGVFFYGYESKNILKSVNSGDKAEIQYDKYIEALKNMKDITPKNKLEQLDTFIKKLKTLDKNSGKISDETLEGNQMF